MPQQPEKAGMTHEKTTPLMEQYFAIKAQFPDALLFFQVGDFYELFFDDAKKAAAYLAIALTKRGKHHGADIPLCGVPIHALDHYLTKLIKGGFAIALCDQLSKPQPGTVVQRGVTKVFTPGTLTETNMLEAKSACYFLSCYPGHERWGLVFGELLTAQLFATTIPAQSARMLEAELIRFAPDEVILPNSSTIGSTAQHFKKLGYYTSIAHSDDVDAADGWVTKQFAAAAQTLQQEVVLKQSLTTLHHYLQKQQPSALEQFKQIHFYQPEDYLILDASTQKNLEIVENAHTSSKKNTLFSIIDHAKTAMGSRTLKKWLQRPLVHEEAINQRLDFIAELKNNIPQLFKLNDLLASCGDIERIVGRIALQRALVPDYLALNATLSIIPEIKDLLSAMHCQLSSMLCSRLANFQPITTLLTASLNDQSDYPHLIKRGFDHNLDYLYDLLHNGKQAFLALEQKETERTGINSLKISYNQITGYYFEITNPNIPRVPDDFIHLQSLSNKKRFTTPQLKALEHDYFKAQHELENVETSVFERVKNEVAESLHDLRHAAQSLAYLDSLFSLTKAAYELGYVRPLFNKEHRIAIEKGRHPIVEHHTGSNFEANDLLLNNTQSTIIITGPNMGGKSTYLRQTALISIMAQCGSFVPATHADLPILDRVFTRIGSGDNLAEGKSTFLVEMEETATICHQATKNSLVILDEVGRGTSTYDGMALAQAILEYIHTNIKARCLFATHYHELTALEQSMPGMINMHAACKRVNDVIIFLHKILPGAAEGSFGLHVARLATLPETIISRAQHILNKLGQEPKSNQFIQEYQPAMASKPVIHPVVTQLQAIDCNAITPKQAFELLWQLSQQAHNQAE